MSTTRLIYAARRKGHRGEAYARDMGCIERQAGEEKKAGKLRVLCFGRFYDDIPGGMQRHVEQLFLSMQGRVDYVHLVPSRNWSRAGFDIQGFPGVRTESINVDGSLALSPGLIREARWWDQRYRFDLVHLHFPDPMSHLASSLMPRKVRHVITWHADITRQRLLFGLYRPFLRRALRQAEAIIVPTPAHITVSRELRRLAQQEKIRIIPFGFDLERFMREAPNADKIRARFPGKRIFALGRHVYYKGFDVLIDAMRALDPGVHLILGGHGPLTESLKTYADRQGLGGQVHFVGHIDENELPAYYQASDIFCLPATSSAEAFGIVQVEAMASGKPVVSTKLETGVSFVNQNGSTGLLVAPGDQCALAEALQRLLQDNRLRESMGRNARERAKKGFALEIMGTKTLELYREITRNTSEYR